MFSGLGAQPQSTDDAGELLNLIPEQLVVQLLETLQIGVVGAADAAVQGSLGFLLLFAVLLQDSQILLLERGLDVLAGRTMALSQPLMVDGVRLDDSQVGVVAGVNGPVELLLLLAEDCPYLVEAVSDCLLLLLDLGRHLLLPVLVGVGDGGDGSGLLLQLLLVLLQGVLDALDGLACGLDLVLPVGPVDGALGADGVAAGEAEIGQLFLGVSLAHVEVLLGLAH